VEQDPFISFLSNLTEKISVEKEHKALMEKINSEQPAPTVSPLEETLSRLQEKISQQVQAHIEVNTPKEEIKVTEDVPIKPIEKSIIPTEEEILEEENFGDFVNKLKDILSSPREAKPKPIKEEKKKEEVPNIVEVKADKPVAAQEEKPVEVDNYVQELEKQTNSEPEKPTNNYVTELDKISTKVASEVEPGKVQDIKKLLEEYMEKYLKKAAVMAEYAGGGGSNAVQYANGGTMNGTLNVTGQYLSGGIDLASIFSGGGGGGGNQNLIFDSTTANLSITNGNTVSLSALSASGSAGNPDVNSIVISNSANWNTTYTTVCANSANWNTAYTLVQNNSASWNNALSAYTFIANGNTSIFDLSSTAPFTNAAGYIVSMNGAIQTPNIDFTITYSGTNYLNLNFTPRTGALIDVQVLGNGVITNSNVVTVSSSNYNPLYVYVNANFIITPPTGNYMVDTTTSGVTGTLPASPALGTVVEFLDPYYTWATNNFVLSASTNIENQNQPVSMNIAGFDLKAVYVGGNYGWRLTQ
jgi:hypothetical protein